MVWDQILAHSEQVEMLRRSVQRGRLGHTFLFTGPAGVGKRRFAVTLAQCLLCENRTESDFDACGTCGGCRQVLAGTHPDLIVVRCPEGKSEIPLELLLGAPDERGKAGLCHELSLRPMAGKRKLAVIDDAERLNDEGANALLKTLEEPPPHSLVILIATSSDRLLPTIRSRCQVLRFSALPTDVVRELLSREELAEGADDLDEIARLSEGSLETARELLDPALRRSRDTLYAALAAEPFLSTRLAGKMLGVVEEAGTETSVQREAASWALRFCVEFYRQSLLMMCNNTEERTGIHPEVSRFAGRFPGRRPDDQELVSELLERTMNAQSQLDAKTTVPLCLETLCDDLGRLRRTIVRGTA